MLAKTIRLRDLTFFEYMAMPADDFYLLSNALAVWEEARQEERAAHARSQAAG